MAEGIYQNVYIHGQGARNRRLCKTLDENENQGRYEETSPTSHGQMQVAERLQLAKLGRARRGGHWAKLSSELFSS